MSFPALSWAVRQKLPSTQKLVLLMLAERHNKDSGQCNPSLELLADDCGLSRRSVIDQIAKLQEAGYLTVRHRARDNVKLPSQYVLHLDFGIPEKVQTEASDPYLLPKEVVNDVHRGSERAAPGVVNDVHEVVNDVHQGSERAAHKPVNKPGIEPKYKKTRVAAPSFQVPDWINKQHWDAWHSCAKRKNATNAQKQMAVDKLAKWREEGIDHAAALESAAIAGWQGLFKPDVPASAMTPGRRSPTTANTHKHAAAYATILEA